jgi:hypothetical protein
LYYDGIFDLNSNLNFSEKEEGNLAGNFEGPSSDYLGQGKHY